MTALFLYIDKWYITGAICHEGNASPIVLPNREDRIWLYFHEDVSANRVSYGKGYQAGYRNNENHYFGNVFSQITSSSATFTEFERPKPLRKIFRSSGIFDDLRKNMENADNIGTYISFSKDITFAQRLVFNKELEENGFTVKQEAASIDHLCLEHARKKSMIDGAGYYLMLNACNENLLCAVYKGDGKIFVRKCEVSLDGYGTDLRSRALTEYVVNNINATENFLHTPQEREDEYLRMLQYVDDWLVRLSAAQSAVPIQLTRITFSNDAHKEYSVTVRGSEIDNRTQVIVEHIVNEITKFVRNSDIRQDEIKGILLIGNTFTNTQFTNKLLNRYSLKGDIHSFRDSDIPSLVSAYSYVDCEQFTSLAQRDRSAGEVELQRIKNAEKEAAAKREAEKDFAARQEEERKRKEGERKFNDALEKGYECENSHDYSGMVDWFKIACNLRPDNKEVQQKYEEAIRLKVEAESRQKIYKETLIEAKKAIEKEDWETAKQKAEEALGYDQNSKEAVRIKEEAIERMKQKNDLERFLDRADLFIKQGLYIQAQEELSKAKFLGIGKKEIKEREEKIRQELSELNKKISVLKAEFENASKGNLFGEALQLGAELVKTDSANSEQWAMRIADIKQRQAKAENDKLRKDELKKGIYKAQWDEDWSQLVKLCEEYLKMEEDNSVTETLNRAKEKLKKTDLQQVDRLIREVNNHIDRGEKDMAEEKLVKLRRNPIVEKYRKEELRELNKRMFHLGDDGKHPNGRVTKEPKRVIGFGIPETKTEQQPERPRTNEDFNFGKDSAKRNPITPNKVHNDTGKSFFGRNDKKPTKISRSTDTNAKKVTNDDFEF